MKNILIIGYFFGIAFAVSAQTVTDFSAPLPSNPTTSESDLKKYPAAQSEVNGITDEGAKCQVNCQSSQMSCYQGANAQKRDECRNSYNTCLKGCPGDPTIQTVDMTNPTSIITDLNVDPNIVNAVITGKVPTANGNSAQGAVPPPPPTSGNLEDAFAPAKK